MPRQRRPNNSLTMTYEESRAKLKQQVVDTETSSSSNESRYDDDEEPSAVNVVRGNLVKLILRTARNRRAGLRRARKLGQVANDVRGTVGQGLTTSRKVSPSRYDVRGTVGAGLRRARKLGQVATTCEEPSGKVYVVRGNLVKSLRRARNRRGRLTSCEETWSSRYDVRGTIGEGLRRARKLGQVATTCEKPSGQVNVVRGNLVKSLRRARNRRDSRYDVLGTVGTGLRRARKLGQVATTCEEPSGQVYDVRGKLVKSLRRARNRRGRFTSCEETWSSRYDVRETVGAGLRRARNLGQVATTCEEPSGQVYVVRGNLVKSLRRARNRRGRILGWSTTGLGTMRNLESDSQASTLSGTKVSEKKDQDVPPQPNSPPDNVFRPDRPAEASLGTKKRGSAPLPIHGIIGLESTQTGFFFPADSANPFPWAVFRWIVTGTVGISRIPLVRTSSELAVRRPGKAPERAVPSPSPGRHAATRSRRVSSSSSPPTADGFETGTPGPSPQSQSFSRGYGSILPTSLAYIVPSTRGCSPWRPDAVMSTTGRGRHSVLRIFKGRLGRTGHRAPCGALPAAGPYLRLSRFQGGQAVKQKR
ncbi:hypothetical protein Tco_0045895 [Tanacetum coccineum]